MKRRRPPAPERTQLERAAVAICRRVYGARCPCDGNAPSVCQSMRGAAVAAIAAIDPEVARRLLEEELNAARRAKV